LTSDPNKTQNLQAYQMEFYYISQRGLVALKRLTNLHDTKYTSHQYSWNFTRTLSDTPRAESENIKLIGACAL